MPRHRECSHAERYNDGHCKVCTRNRQRVTQAKYRAHKRELALLSGQAVRRRGLTMAELLGEQEPHDLL